MKKKQAITLESLVGKHWLSGVELATRHMQVNDYSGKEDVNTISFVLDGTVYTALEDPEDGYRSCLKEIRIEGKEVVKNRFPRVRVMAEYISKPEENSYSTSCDILHMYLDKVGPANGTVLRVGTDNTDDYYPTFEAFFDPKVLGTK